MTARRGTQPASELAGPARAAAPWPGGRDADLALARVHLRAGLLGLARAELEAQAGRAGLDDGGLLDLAEARWRTGDLSGAGDAAQAYLATGAIDPLALVIAAEATAAAGRPGEARTLVGRALERIEGSVEPLFAGMPRHPIWPADVWRTDTAALGTEIAAPGTEIAAPSADTAPPEAAASEAGVVATPLAPELPAPDARVELELGRASLAAGRPDDAALHLAIAIRVAPALAPVVLAAIGEALGETASDVDEAAAASVAPSTPLLEIVRGDAYRLVGHETRAVRAWAAAAGYPQIPQEDR